MSTHTLYLLSGDCRQVAQHLQKEWGPEYLGAIITDPPYEISFMGRKWDNRGIAFDPDVWRGAYNSLVPGGVVKVFGATRTFHRVAAALEDAGFDLLPMGAWVQSEGMPHGLNISKDLDKLVGAQRGKKRVKYPIGGDSFLRMGGQNTRPWIEEARQRGYAEVDDDVALSDAAKVWEGWHTALKPAWEPILVARKPLTPVLP